LYYVIAGNNKMRGKLFSIDSKLLISEYEKLSI